MIEGNFTTVALLAEVPDGTVKPVELGGVSILLCHDGDRIFAIENRCSHAEEPLACGRLRHGWISCPAHGARFDLETGEPLNPPATAPIRTFAVRIEGNAIQVAQ